MATIDSAEKIFDRGPFPHFQKSLGLFRPVGQNVANRAAISVLIGWVPCLVLVVVESLRGSNPAFFFLDFGVHARSLFAAPLFIVCELACLHRLGMIATHFVRSGLVEDEDRPRFNALVSSTRNLMNSTVAEVVALIAAYAIAFGVFRYELLLGGRPWLFSRGVGPEFSRAGWWYSFITIPLLLILFFGWIWRIILWSRFLIRMSRVRLRLIAAHPDKASGLKFLNSAIVGFTPLAFTFGVVTAGSAANRVAYEGATSDAIQTTVAGLLVFVLLLFVGPLLVFVLKLHRAKVAGVFAYGELVDAVGRQFEKKWLDNYDQFGSGALEAPDFSATTDLYQIVANVHEMKLLPFEIRVVISLLVATLLPFVPVVLMTIPVKVILQELARLLV